MRSNEINGAFSSGLPHPRFEAHFFRFHKRLVPALHPTFLALGVSTFKPFLGRPPGEIVRALEPKKQEM